jgi:hypothetical protein
MSLPSLIPRQSVVVRLPGVRMDRGEAVEDWSRPSDLTVSPVSIQPGSGARDHEHADGVTADFTVYFEPEVTVDPRSRLVIDGAEYVQVAAPENWRVGHPLDHLRVRVRRRDG